MGGEERGDGGKPGDDGFCRIGVVSSMKMGQSGGRKRKRTERALTRLLV